ncbi:MAG TPA: TrkA C-terminal domain-containing protein [Acidimicrobiia bacterium]|nr:TrkA C-terminal domain-containing protein [Acidimicrobiia bacterium]
MDERPRNAPPRNLKAMLSEAKDTSELMVDLGYASLFFADTRMADEVGELEERLTDLVHEMREVCVLAARSKRDAEQMSSVLHVVSAIERMGNAAVDVSRIVTHRLGIPPALVADLAAAEEVSHRVRVREGSSLADRKLEEVELPMEVGMRVVALRRGRDWIFDPGGEDLLLPDDVLILRGAREGIAEIRELAGAPEWRIAAIEEDPAITDLDRAVDVLVDMKNVSEAAVGLAYSALLLRDSGLAAQVSQLEDRLDEMREQLELWVLRAAAETVDPSGLRGLLHLGAASEEMGDAAQQLVWLVEEDEEMHPVLAAALGETDDVVVQYPVAEGSPLDGAVVGGTQVGDDTGFHLLAIRRGGRWVYRPRGRITLVAGDEVLANGPRDGRVALAEQAGYELPRDGEGEPY